MKKNLLALVVLLVLVAVAAQFTRNGGNSERAALENDMKASLEALWQQPGQNVELVEAEGGVRALVTVIMSDQGEPNWNEPFLRYVAARHPKVKLQALEIRNLRVGHLKPAETSDPGRRYELVRRQQQAVVDSTLGPGQGLMLLQFRDLAVPQQDPVSENRRAPAQEVEAPTARARGEAPRGRPLEGNMRQVARPAVPTLQLQACLVVQSDFSPEQLQKAFQGLPSHPGDQTRVLKLPARLKRT